MNASEFFATTAGCRCLGDQECHWCAAPCQRLYRHDDPPPVPFTKSASGARRPDNPWCCVGCWRFGWQNTTIGFLDGGRKDRECLRRWSLWIDERNGAKALVWTDRDALLKLLLKPPLRFVLAWLHEATNNPLHLMRLNDHPRIDAATPLHFTLNSIPHTYTVYELDHCLKFGPDGTEPGVQTLWKLLGSPRTEAVPPPPDPSVLDKNGQKRGRPSTNRVTQADQLSKNIRKEITAASGRR